MLILHLPPGSVPAVWLTSSAHTGGRTCVFTPVAHYISHYKLGSWHSNKQSHYWFICRNCVLVLVFLLGGEEEGHDSAFPSPLLDKIPDWQNWVCVSWGRGSNSGLKCIEHKCHVRKATVYQQTCLDVQSQFRPFTQTFLHISAKSCSSFSNCYFEVLAQTASFHLHSYFPHPPLFLI